MPRTRLILLLLVLVVTGGVIVLLTLNDDTETSPTATPETPGVSPSPGGDPTELTAPEEDLQPALDDTVAAGPFDVTMTATVKLPDQVSEGVTDREFTGEGVFDPGSGISEITYDFSKVPNGFGVLGQVDEVDVVYEEGTYSATFDRLDRFIDGREWMGFEFPVFYSLEVVGGDNGQLRELSLTDPSVALALVEGASGLTVDVAAAADASGSPVLDYLAAKLGVEEGQLTGVLGDDGLIERLDYQLRYPPLPVDDDPAILTVSLELVPSTSEFDAKPPVAGDVLPYKQFVKGDG